MLLTVATRSAPPAGALLVDRDGTLVEDVPYNGDPTRVRLRPTVAEGLALARARGLAVAVVSNQSGVARGLLTLTQVRAVNAEVERRAGPVDAWAVCPHGPDDGCACRKPRPAMLLAVLDRLGVDPGRAAMIGDIGADVDAAAAAGTVGVLVPTPVTRRDEVRRAPLLADTFVAAVDLVVDR